MKPTFAIAAMLSSLLIVPACAAAQQLPGEPQAEAAHGVPQIAFTRFTLPNGMRVILSEDHSVPVVTQSFIVDGGKRLERRGRSGFAHLFEHLMFEGSQHAPKGVFDHIVEGYGGTNNASTHDDYTYYFETAPSSALPLLMWLDADRLAYLNVTAENLKNQISVVEEEKRLSVDNVPYGHLLYELGDHTFSNWQNSHSVIGSFQDLDAATLADVKAFFDAFYAPRNIILGIVGDIDPERTRALVTQYFGWLPNRGTIQPVNTTEPLQTAERHVTLTDPHANVPAIVVAWQGPARNTPDFYALSVLGQLLFSGKSSRVYQSLVKDRKLALSVEGGLGYPDADFTDYRAPGLISAFVTYKTGSDPTLLEQLIFREIHEIVANGPTPDELERTKTRMQADWIRAEQTTLDRDQLLLGAALFDGDPNVANTELTALLNVRGEDIQRAAAAFLTHPKTTVVVDLPQKPSSAAAAAGATL